MKRLFLVLFSLCSLSFAFGQDLPSTEDDVPSQQAPTENIEAMKYKPVRAGDKYIKVGIGLGIPLFNTSSKKFAIKTNIYPGPKIFVGMHFYVTDGLSLGGDLSFDFYPTLGKNLYFNVPFSFAIAYTPTYKRWRFPTGINIGGVFMSYLGNKTCGLFINPFFSFYYQYSPDWSFGGELNWAITTEFRKERGYSRANNNLGISFSVRYHY